MARLPELRRERPGARAAGPHPGSPALLGPALLAAGLLAGCDGPAAEGPFALGFEGGEDCVEADVTGVEPASAWTVEAWVRGDPAESDRARPLVEWKGVLTLGAAAGGDSTFVVGDTDGVSWSGTVMDGVLHHVAGTFDGEKATLFVDGEKQAFADGAAPAEVTKTLRIGCNAAAEAYAGLLDELRFSSVVRYEDDFDRPVGPFEKDDDTTLLFHFDEGDGEESVDAAAGIVAGVFGPDWIQFDLAEGG